MLTVAMIIWRLSSNRSETISDKLDISFKEISDRIMKFGYKEQVFYLINERHYSYYSKKLTSQLITELNRFLN